MSRSTIAIILNFILPGAGLSYLRQYRKAIINFLIAVLIALTASIFVYEYSHYVLLAIAAGSAGYAHAVGQAIDDSNASIGTGTPH